jgi:hypothetical protein
MLTQLTDAIQDQINPRAKNPSSPLRGYYQHIDPSPDGAEHFFGPTLCNPIPGKFTPAAEGTRVSGARNQVGDSCGKPIEIRIDYNAHPVCFLGECVATHDPRPVPVKIHREWNSADPASSPGLFEDGIMRGAAVQSATCFYQQVSSEIQSRHSITVDGSSGCKDMASEYQKFVGQFASLTASLKDKANIAEVLSCKKDWDRSIGTGDKDAGPLRQSVPQICAARSALEGMFEHLAACEVLDRAQRAYTAAIGTAQGQRQIFDMLQSKVGDPCGQKCTDGMSWHHVIPASTVQSCVNQCYQDRMPAALRDFIQQRWPSDGSHCDLSEHRPFSPIGVVFGMIDLVGLGGLASRRRGGRRARAWLACLGIAMALLGAGCGNGDATVSPPSGGGGPVGPPDNPPSNNPGGGGVGIHEAGGAQAGNTAEKAIATANHLLGRDGSNAENGGTLAQGAASAGDVAGLAPVAPEGSAQGPAPGSIGGANPGGPGAGGMGNPNGSGGGFGAAGLTTAPSSDGVSGGETAPSGDTGEAGGSYAAAGGAANGAGADGAGGFFGHSAVSVGDGAAPTEEDMSGRADGGTSQQTLVGEDPADYFTRVGLGDSLFKIVERRYRQKSMAWTTDRLRATASGKTGSLK